MLGKTSGLITTYIVWLTTMTADGSSPNQKADKLLLFLEEVSFAGYSSWPWTQLPMGIPSTVWPKFVYFARSPPANRLNRGFLGRGGRNLHDGKFSSGPIVSHVGWFRRLFLHEILIPASCGFCVFDQGWIGWCLVRIHWLVDEDPEDTQKMMDWGHWWRW